MNIVVLKGNLTRDPQIKDVGNSKVANFAIAVNRFYKKADGTKEKETTFINCEAWDSGASRIADWLKKGDSVLIEGSIKTNEWTSEDGKKQTAFKIRVSTFDKLTARSTPGEAVHDEPAQTEEAAVAAAPNSSEDIPF